MEHSDDCYDLDLNERCTECIESHYDGLYQHQEDLLRDSRE